MFDGLDTDWMSQRLQASGHLSQGAVSDISVDPMFAHSDGSFASWMSTISLNYDDGSAGNLPETVLLKVSKPGFWEVARNEAEFYQFASGRDVPVPIPHCYGFEINDTEQQVRLLLEKVSGDFFSFDWDKGERPGINEVKRMLGVLARLHAAFWGLGDLPDYNRRRMDRHLIDELNGAIGFSGLAEQFLQQHGESLTDQQRNAFRCFGGAYLDRIKRHLDQMPQTLTHGDCHFWNFLVPVNPEQSPVLLDWSGWAINTAGADLTYAGIVKNTPEFCERHERELIDYYRSMLAGAGVELEDDLFFADLRHSIVRQLFNVLYMAELVKTPEEGWREMMVSTFAAMDRHGCWALLEGE